MGSSTVPHLKDALGLILLMDVVDGVGVDREPSACRHALRISTRRLSSVGPWYG